MLQYLEAPEAYGISSRAVLDFLDACKAERVELHSLELRRWGRRFLACTFAPFHGRSMHRMYSSGKALCSLACLFAMQDGLIGLDEPVVRVFANRCPKRLPDYMDKATLYHMLTMSSGHDRDVFPEIRDKEDWVKAFMEIPPAYLPGSVYVYNNGTPHMVSEAVRLRTGMALDEYLEERLLSHMGETMDLTRNPQGEPDPSTISITVEAFGKLADFLYHHGRWEGKQLLRPELADLMGQRHLPTPADPRVPEEYLDRGCNGYGFHTRGNGIGGYKLSGGRNQKSCVFPDYQMTASLMANEPREGIVMHLFMERIMLHTAQRPLPDNAEGLVRLKQRLEELNLAPEGAAFSPREQEIQGNVFALEPNAYGKRTLSFAFQEDQVLVRLDGDTMAVGKKGTWLENRPYFLGEPSSFRLNSIPGPPENLYTGAWTGDTEFTFYIRSASRMATDQVHCRFQGEDVEIQVRIDPQRNGKTEITPLVLRGSMICMENGYCSWGGKGKAEEKQCQ